MGMVAWIAKSSIAWSFTVNGASPQTRMVWCLPALWSGGDDGSAYSCAAESGNGEYQATAGKGGISWFVGMLDDPLVVWRFVHLSDVPGVPSCNSGAARGSCLQCRSQFESSCHGVT